MCRALCVMLVAMIVGCSQSPAAPVPGSYVEARAKIAVAKCERAVRCGEIGASERATCMADPNDKASLGYGDDWEQRTADAIASGRLVFDPSAVDACLAAFRGPCIAEVSTSVTARCKVLRPGVPPGGGCTDWSECIDGHCSAQPGCRGTCIAHKKLGRVCSATGNDGLCDDATYCDRGPHGMQGGTCMTKKAVGAACREWNSCGPDLQCLGWHMVREEPGAPEEEVLGKCTAGEASGTSCRPGYAADCAITNVCREAGDGIEVRAAVEVLRVRRPVLAREMRSRASRVRAAAGLREALETSGSSAHSWATGRPTRPATVTTPRVLAPRARCSSWGARASGRSSPEPTSACYLGIATGSRDDE